MNYDIDDKVLINRIRTNYPYIIEFIECKINPVDDFGYIIYILEHLIILKSPDKSSSYYSFFDIDYNYIELLDETYNWIENNEELIQLRML